MILFHQGSIDGKSKVKVEKCHQVAELNLKSINIQKVTFQFQLLHQVALLNFCSTSSIYGTLPKKVPFIFTRWVSTKGDSAFLWISAQPIGAPIEYVRNILHVSDHVPWYVAIACGFLFEDPMCSEYYTEQEQWLVGRSAGEPGGHGWKFQ